MEWLIFLPSLLALGLSLIIRNAFLALSIGALSGAFIYSWNQWSEFPAYVFDIFIGNHIFSSWKMGAFLLTLQLGALSALLDRNNSLERFFNYLNATYEDKRKSLMTLALMGLVCFYDGLANSILLGRVSVKLKDRFAVSNEKLAYIVDSTSSSVACLIIFSTWTAYQISLIQMALENSSFNGQGLQILIQSIPFNLYSVLTLVMVFIAIYFNLNLGTMKKVEMAAEKTFKAKKNISHDKNFKLFKSTFPFIVLFLSFIVFVFILSFFKAPEASLFNQFIYTLSDNSIPWLLNLSAFCSWFSLLLLREKNLLTFKQALISSYTGLMNILKPCMILFGAWAISNVISDLGAGQAISNYYSSIDLANQWLPLSVFVVSCLVAFFTGTSWGTLALMIPLVVPVAADLGTDSMLTAATVGAIFGGAVFGDHCSPLSDTSVVSAFATECELKQHIKTQIPYALVVAGICCILYTLLGLFI
ncbi:MAG: hypothetical protein MK008_13715 [Bdellovibrionales bacterium]|nr:hypothetical protein [Bdellovibrionales bacterium]